MQINHVVSDRRRQSCILKSLNSCIKSNLSVAIKLKFINDFP